MNWLDVLLKLFPDLFGPPKPKLYSPTYEPVHTVTGLDGIPRTINIYYFATMETATWLMGTFGADHIAAVPYLGSGGPEISTARERWLVWKDNIAVNAGQLAVYYTLNGTNPNVTPETAQREVQKLIDGARAMGQKLPVSAQ